MAKKQTKPKTELVQVRVTPEEKAGWEAAAERERRKLSDWVRLAAEDRAQKNHGQSEVKPWP